MSNGTWHDPRLSRRTLLGLGLTAAAAPVLAACGANTSGGGGASSVGFLCTQFTPVDERQRFDNILKSKVSTSVAFNAEDPSTFATTFTTQEKANKVQFSLVGGLHGELAPQVSDLTDLSSLASSLGSLGIPSSLSTLGTFGGNTTLYIPWMQASYIMMINKTALQWLPSGVDPNKLTYDQLLAWATAGKQANGGKAIFGFPAGANGLYHRFFQGYLLPSFTGGQISTFRSADAVTAWNYMKELWAVTAPASTNYDNMQDPLGSGEVLMAWDHVARLATAPTKDPSNWIATPAPSGPKGLGYMLVIVGLGIPKGAPDPDKAQDVIKDLLKPDTQLQVLSDEAFFPTVNVTLPSSLPAAISLEAGAVAAQQAAPNAILSLPPVGLGSQDGAVSQVFKDTFTKICLQNQPIQATLDAGATQLNSILAGLNVPCWAPDPAAAECQAL